MSIVYKENRSYPYLEAYFCYACDSSEPAYTDHSAKEIRICKSFLENIWQGNLNSVFFFLVWQNVTFF